MSSSKYEIVVVGGNLAGTAISHYLLKNTIPALKKLDSSKDYHVTIISPSSHYFWKISAPRVMVKGDQTMYDEIMRPLDKGFSQYNEAFTHVQGVAIGLDVTSKTVKVKAGDSSEQSVKYDSLVIATGTTSATPLWTLHGDHTKTLDALKDVKERLAAAKTVLVGGGGAVGVESAGEVAAAHPNARITLVSGASRLLERSSEALSKRAEDSLKKMGVEVLHNVKATEPTKTADGQTKIKLGSEERVVDIFIDGTGGKPNTDWLPSEWLNDKQRVKVDKENLRVLSSDKVYAIGDVADYSTQTWMDTDFAVAPIASTIGADIVKTLNNGKGASLGVLSFLPGFGSILKAKNFKPLSGTFMVPLGPSNGVGQVMGIQAPSFMVNAIKGKTYFLEMAPKQWNGDAR